MDNTINWKKIGQYLTLAFGISWSAALIMYLFGWKYGSLPCMVLLAVLYMPGPAIATFIVQKYIYKESFKTYGWTLDKADIGKYAKVGLWFLILTALCLLTILALGNTHVVEAFGQLDFSQGAFQTNIGEITKGKLDVTKLPSLPPIIVFSVILIAGFFSSFTVNLPFMFGEEFGWRGLLLKEVQKMGFTTSCLLIGVIWGLWHAPIVLMGHNYPSNPFAGLGMMCLFTTALCPLFAYVRMKTKSILGPCMLHGMINSTAAIYTLFIINKNEFYSSIAGWAGVVAGVVFYTGLLAFDRKFLEDFRKDF
jgi:uncharacterized protein